MVCHTSLEYDVTFTLPDNGPRKLNTKACSSTLNLTNKLQWFSLKRMFHTEQLAKAKANNTNLQYDTYTISNASYQWLNAVNDVFSNSWIILIITVDSLNWVDEYSCYHQRAQAKQRCLAFKWMNMSYNLKKKITEDAKQTCTLS